MPPYALAKSQVSGQDSTLAAKAATSRGSTIKSWPTSRQRRPILIQNGPNPNCSCGRSLFHVVRSLSHTCQRRCVASRGRGDGRRVAFGMDASMERYFRDARKLVLSTRSPTMRLQNSQAIFISCAPIRDHGKAVFLLNGIPLHSRTHVGAMDGADVHIEKGASC